MAYLICRILDSVEDADWDDSAAQSAHFEVFDRFLTSSFTDEEIHAWVSRFPAGLPEGECLLLPETGSILRDLHGLGVEAKKAITEPVLSMSRGMRHFALQRERDGALRLHSLNEVNQYCFFVAGVVGEILARLVALELGESKVEEGTLVKAFHFGLFLQKINLLKDQLQDEVSGRFLVPSRPEILESLREHATLAVDYITSVPEHLLGYRIFCSWSLFLGIASLPWIEQSWREKSLIKIPRTQTQQVLAEVEAVAGDNQRLRELFESVLAVAEAYKNEMQIETRIERVKMNVAAAAPSASVATFDSASSRARNLYTGLLPSVHLKAFGF